ncbi:zinc finger BED domain-containing protein 4-like [Harmonia axyridis]|uniref:zinc finger BED domain-containing protein 4-like n=1 Tax=Harmonia axyridis TaxID=115357 RepID=UPI001E275BDA|nr:zinc finger BED domain-containing protein 4-like [Harmonia axyridis]
MVEGFVDLEDPIRTTMALIDHDLPIISTEEWQFFKELVEILKPLEDVTRVMSGENYLTGSSVIILSHGLSSVYADLNKREFSTISRRVILSLLEGINSRLGGLEGSMSLILSTFLDPRFKNIAFSADSVGEKAKRMAIGAIREKLNETPRIQENERNSVENIERNSVWGNFERKIATLRPSGTVQSKVWIVEVNRYLEEPPIPRRENPLIWWKNKQHNFPNLAKLAREKLITVATSVPCERLFSKSEIVLSDRRNRLSNDKVTKILFLHINKEK